MKIAISATGKGIDNDVDVRFGRCPYFLIIEIENEAIKNSKAIENTAVQQSHGAGVSAAELVAKENVDAIITDNMGPRAFDVFRQFGIPIFKSDGKIEEVVRRYINGELSEIKSSTGPRHGGRI